eukprot:1372903-Alexandrium_andersonii.AAC.1
MSASLVGSEMCIRDRVRAASGVHSEALCQCWNGRAPIGADPPGKLGKAPGSSRSAGASDSSGDEVANVVGA